MSLDIYQIAEAFRSHRFAVTHPYMADEIKWNMVGKEDLVGREAVMDRCTQAAKFLETVFYHLHEAKDLSAGALCRCGRHCTMSRLGKSISSVASCDVLQFSGERLAGITSYVIELNKP